MVKCLGYFYGPNISENLHYLDSAIKGLHELIEMNLALMDGLEDSQSIEQHILDLQEMIRSTQIDKMITALPDTVGDTITMISKVSSLLKNAKRDTQIGISAE